MKHRYEIKSNSAGYLWQCSVCFKTCPYPSGPDNSKCPGTFENDAALEDLDKAMAAIPAPTCYADYGKVYRVLPGGGFEEI